MNRLISCSGGYIGVASFLTVGPAIALSAVGMISPAQFKIIVCYGAVIAFVSHFGTKAYVVFYLVIVLIVGAATSMTATIAMFYPGAGNYVIAVIGILSCIQIVWFMLSHLYANRRYCRSKTWLETLRIFSDSSVWARLDI